MPKTSLLTSPTITFILIHLLLLIPPNIWALFGVIATVATKEIQSAVIFNTFRTLVLLATLLPIMAVIDRNQKHDHSGNRLFEASPKLVQQYMWSKIPNTKNMLLLVLCGFLMCITNQYLFVHGMMMTSPFMAAIMSSLNPIFSNIIAILLKNEKPSFAKFVGTIIAIAGAISLIIINSSTTPGTAAPEEQVFTFLGISITLKSLLGASLLLCTCISFSICINVTRIVLSRGVTSITATFWTFFWGLLMLLGISLFTYQDYARMLTLTWKAWLSVAFCGTVAGSVVMVLQTFLTKASSPTLLALSACGIPPLSLVYTFLFFGKVDNFSWFSLIGVGLILAGVLIVITTKWFEGRGAPAAPVAATKEDVAISDAPLEEELKEGEKNELLANDSLAEDATSPEVADQEEKTVVEAKDLV